MKNLEKTYDPKQFEDRIYKAWEDAEAFVARANSGKKPYTISMPPPNVTGVLHMGHAMNNTLQDIVIRWKRMSGYEALWVPGTDHASISTEAKVVEKVRAEGTTKQELGREKFLEKAWEWTHEYGDNIVNQLKKLGVSCDWSRQRFTLDEGLSKAVHKVFVDYYNEGLIYQGDRIVNWCPSCETAISDAEVDHVDENGHLWYISYPVKDSDESLTIATTRPETLLGDLAVAVNPEDERYTHLVGKTLILPLVGREIPIVADEYVDMEFGTGSVKITPSHDPNDFEVGERHDLGQCVVITETGKIAEGYGEYSGKDRYVARKMMLKDLEEQGFLTKTEDYSHAVGHCERCNTVIEPLLSKQWFVKMEDLAKPAKEAVASGKLKLIPERFDKIYYNWLDNIKDWCISRQLWWGHRIPVWYCQDCGHVIVQEDTPTSCPECGSKHLEQDPDTLDTWFSSALWPFSTLGWPEQTEDFKYFFPTNTLMTGYDIIFFWVIRMVFSSIHETGEIPFDHVYFNGLVRDAEGRKMSKSLGNGIDPLEVIDKYGADALRFTIVTGNAPGNDTRFSEERVTASRNFANKLWNATRFVLMNLEDDETYDLQKANLEIEDLWILSRFNKTAKTINENLEKFEIGLAAAALYDFTWFQFCDWYIEFTKSRLNGEDKDRRYAAQATLNYVLNGVLRLMHPYMPYITEEIWGFLPQTEGQIIRADFPQYDASNDHPEEEEAIDLIVTAITAIRNQRQEKNIPMGKKAPVQIYAQDAAVRETVKNLSYEFENLASASAVEIFEEDPMTDNAIPIVLEKCKIYLPLEGLVDYEKELQKLEKELENLDGEIKRASAKLANESFTSKAPEAVVQKEVDKKNSAEAMRVELLASIEEVKRHL